jgi:hypothetical protein
MKPIRIQRKRTKGWRMPENTVYVGRPTKWGNPFRVMEVGGIWQIKTDGTDICARILTENGHFKYASKEEALKDAVKLYEIWLFPYTHEKGTIDDYFVSEIRLNELRELKGHNLSCFCPLDQPCHADVLLKYANK